MILGGLRTTLSDRHSAWAFPAGCAAVTVGVLLHLPMFLMSRDMNYRLADMPVDAAMLFGMCLIVGGVCVAAYGLLPRGFRKGASAEAKVVVAAPEDAGLRPAHWRLMGALTVALVIDVMKPASLGFTIPGMVAEYGVSRETASLVPFFALTGTVAGSVLWGVVADFYGRKASILLSAVMFVGTSICGVMPSISWNMGMCFMMGAAAGGMLPVTYTLLAEMMPSRHRGWSLVLVGGLGAVGGYFAASALSALLQPVFGWRILWLANLPTGLILVLLGNLIPESAKFLIAFGRHAEAEATMRRFGTVARDAALPAAAPERPAPYLRETGLAGRFVALSVTAFAWGLVNFGLLLWLPADLVARGYSVGSSSRLLALSSLIAIPTIFLAAWLYSRWSTKWSLVTMIGVTALGLGGVLMLELGEIDSPVLPVALLLVGSNGVIATLLPYSTESFPLRVRGRATGWVAACSKGGGVLAQALGIMGMVPSMPMVALLIIVPTALAVILVAWAGLETRGADLRDLDKFKEPLGVRSAA